MKKILLTSVGIFLFGNIAFSQGFFKLLWYDEFNGSTLDQTKWDYQVGTGDSEGLTDWGNNEKQYYAKENVSIKDGMLIIAAKKEQKGNKSFTSGRLFTRGKFSTTYGRMEARISSPAVQGLWPAFWLLPQNSPYGTWAASGEIDIMEAKGRLPEQYSGAIHYGGVWPGNTYSGTGDYHIPTGGTIENFHIYALEWKAGEIAWYCDGNLVARKTSWFSQNGPFPAPFDTNFYILLNLAIGGNFDENRMPPESFTAGEMKIDYVRVYKWDDKLTKPEVPTGITQPEISRITISQTDNSIVINPVQEVQYAGLYLANGQLSAKVENENVINTSGLNKGNYILKVQDISGMSGTFKVIVK